MGPDAAKVPDVARHSITRSPPIRKLRLDMPSLVPLLRPNPAKVTTTKLVLVFAQIMAGKRADHVAILDLFAVAAGSDSRQFTLQFAKLSDSFTYRVKLLRCYPIRIGARLVRVCAEFDQLAYCLDLQPEIAGMLYECEAVAFIERVSALVPFRALGRSQKAHLLVITYGRYLDTGAPGQVSNRQHDRSHNNSNISIERRGIADALQWEHLPQQNTRSFEPRSSVGHLNL